MWPRIWNTLQWWAVTWQLETGGVKRRQVRESASIGCMDAQEGLMQRHTTVQKGQNIAHLQGDLRRI